MHVCALIYFIYVYICTHIHIHTWANCNSTLKTQVTFTSFTRFFLKPASWLVKRPSFGDPFECSVYLPLYFTFIAYVSHQTMHSWGTGHCLCCLSFWYIIDTQ